MNDIQVFDKVISHGYADAIEKDLINFSFPWFYVNDVTNKNHNSNSGLVHLVYDSDKEVSEWYPFIKPLVFSIVEAAGHTLVDLLRIRVGFLTPATGDNHRHNAPHVDFLMPHYTACYYVSDSDGDTILFDQTIADMQTNEISESTMLDYVSRTEFTVASQITPKKGSVCVFDGRRFHASTKPKLHDRRLVITINYIGITQ